MRSTTGNLTLFTFFLLLPWFLSFSKSRFRLYFLFQRKKLRWCSKLSQAFLILVFSLRFSLSKIHAHVWPTKYLSFLLSTSFLHQTSFVPNDTKYFHSNKGFHKIRFCHWKASSLYQIKNKNIVFDNLSELWFSAKEEKIWSM